MIVKRSDVDAVSKQANHPWPGPEWPQFILNHLPTGVLTVDSHFKVNYMNPMAEQLTGRSKDDSLGQHCGSVLRGGLCSKDCPLRKVMSQERNSVTVETIINQAGGRVIPVSLRIAAMYDQEGKLVGAVELFADISHVKRLEAERAQTLSLFAHDMKSPLIAVGGLVERLLEGRAGELDAKQLHYLSIINDQIKRVQSMALDFLDTARLGKEGPELVTTPVDLNQLLAGLAVEYAERAKGAGLELVLELDPSLPKVQADPQRLTRVFTNLLDNAIKYSAQGRVRLEASSSAPGQVVIQVSDQGPGLDPEDLAGLFTPFFRGSAAQGVEGTGLGLAAVKAIVEAHGGGIRAENRGGRGARFTVSLPAEKTEGG
jgi:PAS domain S-box-containing protein